MLEKPLVRSVVQTTAEVAPKHAFDFWRDTVLASTCLLTNGSDGKQSFSATRLVAVSEETTLLHTKSIKIDVARSVHQIRRDERDDITIAFFVQGSGYQRQRNRGALLSPGDISVVEASRASAVGDHEDYEEIHLVVSRALFRAHVGDPELLVGRKIDKSPPSILFTTYLRTYADLVSDMTETEAGVAVEGVLHLLRGIVGMVEGEISKDALRSLALVQIERHLHDSSFGAEALIKALHVSRSRLYAAFSDDGGVATKIRDARLDRVHRYLSLSMYNRDSISALMIKCGFEDLSSFSKAFRRRFGISPRGFRGLHQ